MKPFLFATAAVCFLVFLAIDQTAKQPMTYSNTQQLVQIK